MKTIFVETTNAFKTPKELKQKYKNFFVTRYHNKEIIIVTKTDSKIYNFIIKEKTNIPLYKQCMDMQMGKIPNKIKEENRTYRVCEIPMCETKRYEVYKEN